MKVSSMFPKRYATGDDLQGKPLTLTILQVKSEKMRPQSTAPEVDKWVVYFKESKKGIVLNRTLAYQIADVLGSQETDDWVGKRITLFPQPISVAGKRVISIRAREARDDMTSDQIPESIGND